MAVEAVTKLEIHPPEIAEQVSGSRISGPRPEFFQQKVLEPIPRS
jgi:hypothetical protein